MIARYYLVLQALALLLPAALCLVTGRDISQERSRSYTLTVDPEKHFQGTVADFYKNGFEKMKGFQVPKLDEDFGAFGYLMASFTGIVHVMRKHGVKQGAPLECDPGKDCGYAARMGWTAFRNLDGGRAWTDARQVGLVTVMPEHEAVLAFFKGSTEPSNLMAAARYGWADDEDQVVETRLGIPGARVHRGFWAALDEIYPQLREGVEAAHAAHPGFTILLAGHSMGGAVTHLAAARLRADPKLRVSDAARAGIKAFAMASTRVGNRAFAEGLTERFPDFVRATSADDVIPSLPPAKGAAQVWGVGLPVPESLDFLEYVHTPVEVWMRSEEEKRRTTEGGAVGLGHHPVVYQFDTYYCLGYNNFQCSASQSKVLGLLRFKTNHAKYFGIQT